MKATLTKKTSFLITIDTETFLTNGDLLPFETNIYGDIDGTEFGVKRIMDICENFSIKATFFVDVYMYHRYGKDKVSTLCKIINERGHDVQLHAHTSWLPNLPREYVSSYELKDQIAIIAEGTRLIEEWIGRRPIAFRAGGYGLNLDTIRALEANEYIIDSSYFPFHKNCLLSKQLNHKYENNTFMIGSIIEIPISTYWLIHTSFYRKNSKLDVNACSYQEFKDIIPKFIHCNISFVVLFLHSFSFLKWNKDNSRVIPDYVTLKKFEKILSFITTLHDVDFLTIKETLPLLVMNEDVSFNFTPSLSPFNVFPRIFNRLS